MEKTKKIVFKGVINGVEYDDLGKFNKAVYDIDDHDNISISTEMKTIYEDDECEDKCICGNKCKCLDDKNEDKKNYKSVFNIDVDKEIEEAEKDNHKTYFEFNDMAVDTCKLVNHDNAEDVVKDADGLLDNVLLNKQVLQSVDRELKEKIDKKLAEVEELCKQRENNKKAFITAENLEYLISTVREKAVNSMKNVKEEEDSKNDCSKKWTSSIFDYATPFKDVNELLKFFAW